MDELTMWKIQYKYKNIVFPNLYNLLIKFLLDNHINYLDLILSEYIDVKNIIYFLRNKPITSEKELLDYTIRYIEYKHGIFTKAKSKPTPSSNNNI